MFNAKIQGPMVQFMYMRNKEACHSETRSTGSSRELVKVGCGCGFGFGRGLGLEQGFGLAEAFGIRPGVGFGSGFGLGW